MSKRTTTALHLVLASLSKKSRESYQRAVSAYLDFSKTHLKIRTHWPASVLSTLEFVAHLHHLGYAASTIISYTSALSFVHNLSLDPDPTKSFLIKKALAGISKLKPAQDLRLPITPHVLRRLIRAAKLTAKSSFHAKLFQAMFSLAFHAFLRVGEMTACSKHDKAVLQARDISFRRNKKGNLQDILLTIRRFKHQGSRPAVTLVITAQHNHYCPVRLLHRYFQLRGPKSGPLFVFKDRTPVSRTFFASYLRQCVTYVGLDGARYKGHSFRIGAATAAYSQGMSDARIKQMGRWQSSAFKKYIRIPTISTP